CCQVFASAFVSPDIITAVQHRSSPVSVTQKQTGTIAGNDSRRCCRRPASLLQPSTHHRCFRLWGGRMILEYHCLILQTFPTGPTSPGVSAMNGSQPRKLEREAQRLTASHRELIDRIGRAVPGDGVIQPMTGLFLARLSAPLEPVHAVLEPSFCVIAQGSKEMLLGDCRYRYDASTYLLTTVDLPRVSQVLEATPTRPYLSFRLVLRPDMVSSVLLD